MTNLALLCLNLVLAVGGVAVDMPVLALMNGLVAGALAVCVADDLKPERR